MGRPVVVQIDLDGVLADFMTAFTTRAKRLGFTDRVSGNASQLTWDAYGDVPADKVDEVWASVKADRGFWYYMDPLVSRTMFRWIDDLQHAADVYFVTARVGDGAKAASTRWLEDQGVYHPAVIRTPYKGRTAYAIRATHVIDDNWDNAVDVADASNARSYILDRPYNQGEHPAVIRVKTVGDFLTQVEKETAA